MKNYVVKALIEFDDYEGLDTSNPQNPFIKRTVGTVFECTKDRYLYLLENKAVELMGINTMPPKIKNVKKAIERIEESAKEIVELENKSKKKTSKK